ncbi:MAG: ImmA/IrrE family metallo-endopeptidase [Oligoflexales bacterium]
MLAIFPKVAECALDQDVEKLACMVRHYFGADKGYRPQISVLEICESISLPVYKYDLNYAGALVCKDQAGAFEACLFLNGNFATEFEREFTTAHMLGHFLLHIQPSIIRGELKSRGFKEAVSVHERYAKGVYDGTREAALEKQADDFAASLFMPYGMLNRARLRIGDNNKLADFFGVPPGVLARRIQTISQAELTPEPGLVHKNADVEHVPSPNFLQLYQTMDKAKAEPPRAEAPKSGKGMDRIREIARKLDAGVK